jgi:spermidine synthase
MLEQLKADEAKLLASKSDGQECWQVWQNEQYRWLQDSSAIVHSALNLNNPQADALPHTKAMALSFAFTESLERIFLAGLGGGDQLRQIDQLATAAVIDCIDNSAQVIELQQRFFPVAANNNKVNISECELAAALAGDGCCYDLILLDVLSVNASPECLWQTSFYQQCQKRMKPGGVLAVNIVTPNQQALLSLAVSLRQFFC